MPTPVNCNCNLLFPFFFAAEVAAAAASGNEEAPADAVPIDENLFDEDLDDLEDELEALNVE